MLGLIFTGGEGPPAQVVCKLLEAETQNVLIVAADSGLAAADRAGIKPDWVIGDMDSLDDKSRLASLPPDRVIRMPHDKDFTDTELAFSLAVKKDCGRIWIIGGGGGRIDHLFGIRSLFEREIFPCRWITEGADIRCVDADLKSGNQANERRFADNSLRGCPEKGAVVSVFPLGAGPWEAESTGLKWPLDGLTWDRGFFGVSNVAVNGDFSVTAQKGRFMVILPNTPQ
ncbi:MAG: thiamine diphosphokinase [Treponema sp.]|nr:thiamine diphosphokinase [Treponema sp.]